MDAIARLRRHVALAAVCLAATACFDPSAPGDLTGTDGPDGPNGSTGGTTDLPGGSEPGQGTSGDTTDPATTDEPGTSAGPGTTGEPGTTDDSSTSDATTAEGTMGGETNPTTGSGTCEGVCAPDVPDGWAGPVVMQLADGDGTLSDCPAAFPTQVDDVFIGLEVDATTCGCSCGDVTGVTCPSTATLSERDNCFQFLFNPDSQGVGSSCVRVNTAINWPAFSALASANMSAASCPATATESFPEPQWDNLARTCSGATGGACEGDGQCMDEQGDFGDVCVYQNGDVECPGAYPVKHLGHDDAIDTRDCENTCECTSPQASCAGTVRFYSESDDVGTPSCGGAPLATRNVGVCGVSPSISNPSAEYTSAGFVSQGCTASTPAALGEVTPTGATTICCLG